MNEEQLKRIVHIQIECRWCGRQTEVLTDNAIGMEFQCQRCGGQRFKRKVL